MTQAEKIRSVIDSAKKSNEAELFRKYEAYRPSNSPQRTLSVQPKHETPKQR